jgi:hypothetical protein
MAVVSLKPPAALPRPQGSRYPLNMKLCRPAGLDKFHMRKVSFFYRESNKASYVEQPPERPSFTPTKKIGQVILLYTFIFIFLGTRLEEKGFCTK